MTTNELRDLLELHGYPCRIKGNEVAVQTCLFCGNSKYNCELNPIVGYYHAWCCGAKGTVQKFLKDFLRVDKNIPVRKMEQILAPKLELDKSIYTELTADWALNYLTSRDIDPVDIRMYEIGQGRGPKWDGRVVFPLREYFSQTHVGYIGRAAAPGVSPKYWAQWTGKKTVTGYLTRAEIHVVVEGVFDGIKIHKAGYNAAVLGGVAEAEVEMWAARVPKGHTIVVMLDGEAQDEATRLFWRIIPVHEPTKQLHLPDGFDPAALDPRILNILIRRIL